MKDTKELTTQKAPSARSHEEAAQQLYDAMYGPEGHVDRDIVALFVNALRAAESRGRERGIEEAALRVHRLGALYAERAAEILAGPTHDYDVPVAQRHQAIADALMCGEGEVRALTSGASATDRSPNKAALIQDAPTKTSAPTFTSGAAPPRSARLNRTHEDSCPWSPLYQECTCEGGPRG